MSKRKHTARERKARSRRNTVQEIDPENYPSLEEEPLRPRELEAKAHWEQFRPTYVALLRKQGGEEALDLAIRKASHLTEYNILKACMENPNLSGLQAREMFDSQWLFPPPESTHRVPCRRHGSTIPHICEDEPDYSPPDSDGA